MATNYQSAKVIADLFGFESVRRVQQLTQDGVIETVPVKEDGKTVNRYDLVPTIKKYIKFLQDKAYGREQSEEEASLETRKLKADAGIKESKEKIIKLELKELEGKMHRAEDIEEMVTNLCIDIRSVFLAIPGKLAVDLANMSEATEISGRLREEICDALNTLADHEYDPEKYREKVRERNGYDREASSEPE